MIFLTRALHWCHGIWLSCAFKHTVNMMLIYITQKCICFSCQPNRASTVSLGPTTANKRERYVLEQRRTIRTPVMFTCILTPSVFGLVLCSSLLLPPLLYKSTKESMYLMYPYFIHVSFYFLRLVQQGMYMYLTLI